MSLSRSVSHEHKLLVARKLLGAPGIDTRSKDATKGSWPYYQEQEATSNCMSTVQGRSLTKVMVASEALEEVKVSDFQAEKTEDSHLSIYKYRN